MLLEISGVPGEDTEVGPHSLLQGIFPGLDTGFKSWPPTLQADSLLSEPPGKPGIGIYHLNCVEVYYSNGNQRSLLKKKKSIA